MVLLHDMVNISRIEGRGYSNYAVFHGMINRRVVMIFVDVLLHNHSDFQIDVCSPEEDTKSHPYVFIDP